MKNQLRKIFNFFGYEIRRTHSFPVGSCNRPVGSMEKLLEDLKFRGLRCNAIIDVGANRGYWSIMAQGIFPFAKFCLIEPQVEMEEDLRSFCNKSKNSIYFLAGAGAASDKKYLTIWDNLAGSSFLPKEDEELKEKGKQRIMEIITIDEIIDNNKFDVPELIKLDIQGYELEALKGAAKIFGKTEVFILEVSLFAFSDGPGMPILSEVVDFMAQRDYVVYDFPGFSRRPFDGALGQCDICFVKRDGFLRSSNDWAK